MEYKKSMIIIILAIFLFSIASVCASDANDTVIASEDTTPIEIAQSDEISVNDNNQAIGQSNDEEIMSEGNTGTFSELQTNISAISSGTLELDRNYVYDEGFDTSGIKIDKKITIDGKGYTIDAQGKSRVFNIQSRDVTIKNLTIKNANYDGDGGAVYFAKSGRVTNCNFINNTAQNGGAIYFSDTGNVENCNFIDSHAKEWGGAVFIWNGGSVTNSNFTNNTATKYGGAIRIFSGGVINSNFVNNSATNNDGGAIIMQSGSVTNCSFTNNTAANYGGAVCSIENCEVTDCSFANNAATNNGGGAVFLTETGTVTNCNFTNNTASRYSGAVYFTYAGTVENCNFNDNKATGSTGYGGAVYFSAKGTVTNCNFVNNTAANYGGAIRFRGASTLLNCNFTGNNAITGSAIYFNSASAIKTVSNSCFLNNRANAKELQFTKNENNITITFTGNDNLLNAIYSAGDISFTNVTYWGENRVTNTDSLAIKPVRSNRLAGQNITVSVVINGKVILNNVKVTDNEGRIVLDINVGENYYIGARHDTDSYYTEVQNMDTNMKFYANVTSQTTHNKTVNITAKSNILSEVMYGKLLFILPNGANITANYTGNGTWWAEHKFEDYAVYQVNATYVGLDNVNINNGTISISKTPTNITVENTTVDLFIYDSIDTGAVLTPVDAGNLTFTSSNSSVAKVENGKIMAVGEGTANITVSFAGSDDYAAAENKTIIVNVVKYGSKVTISPINDTVYPNNVTIKYSIENKTNVTVTVDGVSTDKIIITNDTITVVGLDAGKYTIIIINNESEMYYKSNDTKSFTVNKLATSISAADVSTTYNINKDLVITLKDADGNLLTGVDVSVDLNGVKNYVTDTNGQVKVSTAGLAPKTYSTIITFKGNTNYIGSSAEVKVIINKATPKIIAKKKTYKAKKKTKKFTITLKDNTGKPIKNAKVRLMVKKIAKKSKKKSSNKKSKSDKNKNYAKTNSKGKATFKVLKTKKGKYTAKVKFYGNQYYNKATKTVKIVIK